MTTEKFEELTKWAGRIAGAFYRTERVWYDHQGVDVPELRSIIVERIVTENLLDAPVKVRNVYAKFSMLDELRDAKGWKRCGLRKDQVKNGATPKMLCYDDRKIAVDMDGNRINVYRRKSLG